MAFVTELEHVDFLKNLSATHADLIAMVTQIKDCPSGTILFREREESPYIFFVLSGTVALEIEMPQQGAVEIQTLDAGELLGWSPVLELGPMTATARTIDACRIAAIGVDRLAALWEHDAAFGMAFMRQLAITLAKRLRATRFRLSH